MNLLRAMPLAQRQVLFVAAVVAMALLSMYVQLLHDSLQRGIELREVQRVAGIRKPAKPAPAEAQPASLRQRQAANVTDARAR